ncbi:hypothetical protein [Novosphingobium sp. 9U]|uniref:hypothetical protein n=1 Tax=Novosphingobium sp. 9U TaxID=2653158 RepID=UPI0012F1E40B|nr:hypothetical protein [Novosphingobium sp. 9U]VWX46912.1 conserved hypothetical protein [Novosphingobium sp. 9U]
MAKSTLRKRLANLTSSGRASGSTKETVKKALPGKPEELHGPSPNPATNLLLADVALRTGTMIARRAVERQLLGAKYPTRKAAAILRGRSLTESALHSVLARVAVRSVPGAILVGGGLVAKTLYDRATGRQARGDGEAKLHEMAKDGADEV